MKRILVFTAVFVFAAVLPFGITPSANSQVSPQTIVGEVISVNQGTLRLKEDNSQTEYELRGSPARLRDVDTGYRVEVKETNGKLLSLTILGMPTQAQPEPYQRFTVTRQNGQIIATKIGEPSAASSTGELHRESQETAVLIDLNFSGDITGQVTLIDQGRIRIKEDSTQTEYEFTAPPTKLADVATGYRVEAKAANGRISSLTVLGMPMQAEPDPSQRFKVIVR